MRPLRRGRRRSGSRRGVHSGERRRSGGDGGRNRWRSRGGVSGSGRGTGSGSRLGGTTGRIGGGRSFGFAGSGSSILNGLAVSGRVGEGAVDNRDRHARRQLGGVNGKRHIGASLVHDVIERRSLGDGELETSVVGEVVERGGADDRSSGFDDVNETEQASVAQEVGLDRGEEIASGRVGAVDRALEVRDGKVGIDVRRELGKDGRDAESTVGQVVGIRDGDRSGAEEAAIRVFSVVVSTGGQSLRHCACVDRTGYIGAHGIRVRDLRLQAETLADDGVGIKDLANSGSRDVGSLEVGSATLRHLLSRFLESFVRTRLLVTKLSHKVVKDRDDRVLAGEHCLSVTARPVLKQAEHTRQKCRGREALGEGSIGEQTENGLLALLAEPRNQRSSAAHLATVFTHGRPKMGMVLGST